MRLTTLAFWCWWLLVALFVCEAIVFTKGCRAGEIAYDLSPPTTSCDGSPLTDFDHYLVQLYRCGGSPPLVFNLPANTDSVRFTVADGATGWTQVWAVDHSGNRSCGYLSATWAVPAVAAIVPPPPDTASTGVTGRYYRGLNRDHFIASRRDTSIAFLWGTGSPWIDVPADSFSVEWDGKVAIPTAGAWTFYVTSEDGIQFYIDWTYSINAYAVSPLQERSKSMTLTAGLHDLHLNYMARLGNSECTLRWSGPGVPKATIPRSAFR